MKRALGHAPMIPLIRPGGKPGGCECQLQQADRLSDLRHCLNTIGSAPDVRALSIGPRGCISPAPGAFLITSVLLSDRAELAALSPRSGPRYAPRPMRLLRRSALQASLKLPGGPCQSLAGPGLFWALPLLIKSRYPSKFSRARVVPIGPPANAAVARACSDAYTLVSVQPLATCLGVVCST